MASRIAFWFAAAVTAGAARRCRFVTKNRTIVKRAVTLSVTDRESRSVPAPAAARGKVHRLTDSAWLGVENGSALAQNNLRQQSTLPTTSSSLSGVSSLG
jgi:hypothetical protein